MRHCGVRRPPVVVVPRARLSYIRLAAGLQWSALTRSHSLGEMLVREVPVTEVGSIDRQLHDRVAPQLRAQRTLGDVLSWGRLQSPPRTVAEIITQDEYTHDVLVALEAPYYLVFDTT